MINGLEQRTMLKIPTTNFMGKPGRDPYSTPKVVACLEGRVSMEKRK